MNDPANLSSHDLTPLLEGAAVAPLDERGWIHVTGPDRVRWLNGMVTNSIQSLAPGEGCYNFVLSAQGRIQADLTAFAREDSLRLQTDRGRLPALLALLERFLIMDEVELTNQSEDGSGLAILGPRAASLLANLGLPVQELAELSFASAVRNGQNVHLIHAHSPLIPRYELWADPATIREITAALTSAGASHASAEALHGLRLLEGTPLFGTDIRDRDLPQETAMHGSVSRALHFSKGCYLGQEIVERIHSRGNVHRTFSGFVLEGAPDSPLPAPGTSLHGEGAPDKSIGELTSVASINLPAGSVQLALGYLRREALECGASLLFAGGQARPIALPAAAAALLHPTS